MISLFSGCLLLITLGVSVGIWKRKEIKRLLSVNSLFKPDRIIANFCNMNRIFLHVEMPRGSGPVSPLPQGPPMAMPSGYRDWVSARVVTSMLVLHRGEIVHEAYYQGTGAEDRRISWSIAKSYLSVLFGILVDEGYITSLEDPIVKYAHSLKGGAYDAATVRDVLQMASGVTFDEDYLNFHSDINRMGRILAFGGKMDAFAEGLKKTFAKPGDIWQYTSIDTHVIGMVARGATGRAIPDLMAEKVIAPLGMECAPYYLTDGDGVAFVLGGLNITTRDFGRFGQMVLQNGMWQGRRVAPADWIAASTTPSAPTQPEDLGYGYQWWMPVDAEPGEFMGRGIYGQYIYINKRADMVIVSTAADQLFREPVIIAQNIDMFRQIVAVSEGKKDGTR